MPQVNFVGGLLKAEAKPLKNQTQSLKRIKSF